LQEEVEELKKEIKDLEHIIKNYDEIG